MVKLGDVARITPLDKSVNSELPDVDDPEGLRNAAEHVHSFLRTKIKEKPTSIVRRLDGQPGRDWEGKILSQIIYKLWPRLADRVLVTEEEARARSGVLLDYMVRSSIIKCIRKTYQDVPAKWWVSDNFPALVVTYVDDPKDADETPEEIDQAVEEAVEEEDTEVPEVDGDYPCREPECKADLTTSQARSGHERKVHNMVAKLDGTRFYYGTADFTIKYVTDSIMEALQAATLPLTFYGVCTVVAEKDPRLGKPVVRDHLSGLVDAGLVVQTKPNTFTYYEAAPQGALSGPVAGLLAAVVEEKTRQEEAKAAAVVWTAPVPEDLKSSIEYAKHITSTALGNMRNVQETIDRLAAYAVDKDREIAALRQRLMAAPKSSDKEKELEAELTEVKRERDLYKGKVESFEKALSVLRIK